MKAAIGGHIQILSQQVYAAFTASTGSNYETQDIKALYLANKLVSGGLTPATVNYTMGDATPPILTLPADKTVDATGPSGATVSFAGEIKAVDDVDGAVDFTTSPASGSTFPLGVTTVTVAATDKAGYTTSGTFTVTVKP